MLLDGHEVATRDRARERERGTDTERVDHRRLHQRCERVERHATGRGEPLDLAQQRDEMVRGDDRGRVVLHASVVGKVERLQPEQCARARRPAGHRRPRPTSRAAARARWRRWETTATDATHRPARRAARQRDRRTRRAHGIPPGARPAHPVRATPRPFGAADSIARSGVAMITTAAPFPASDTSAACEPRHATAAVVEIASGARPATDTTSQPCSTERQRDRRTRAPGADECESLASRRLGCFHVRSVDVA